MQDIRIAAVTCRAWVGQTYQNLARTVHWVHQAQTAGADLVCFPELNITGYWNHEQINDNALAPDSPICRKLGDLAGQTGIVILAGLAERSSNGAPYASHWVYWPDGRSAAYRKLYLAPNEKPFFSAGHEIPLFSIGGWNFGIQLCYDGHFPELSTAMAAKGAHILFIPHASPRGDAAAKHLSWMRHLPARAFDNGMFVVACNQCGENGRGIEFPGHAMIIGPSGQLLKKRNSGEEGMLLATLRAEDLKAVRSHPMRYFFPNRRPELYR